MNGCLRIDHEDFTLTLKYCHKHIHVKSHFEYRRKEWWEVARCCHDPPPEPRTHALLFGSVWQWHQVEHIGGVGNGT